MSYTTLDADRIIKTLERRIGERFPGAGLLGVCNELLAVTRDTKARIAAIEASNYFLRAISVAAMSAGIVLLFYIGTIIEVKRDTENLYGVLQGFDSAFNIVVLMGAGAIFLSSIESRWKQQKVLDHLHELRSIIHVIDIHQLTKDEPRWSESRLHDGTLAETDDDRLRTVQVSGLLFGNAVAVVEGGRTLCAGHA